MPLGQDIFQAALAVSPLFGHPLLAVADTSGQGAGLTLSVGEINPGTYRVSIPVLSLSGDGQFARLTVGDGHTAYITAAETHVEEIEVTTGSSLTLTLGGDEVAGSVDLKHVNVQLST